METLLQMAHQMQHLAAGPQGIICWMSTDKGVRVVSVNSVVGFEVSKESPAVSMFY